MSYGRARGLKPHIRASVSCSAYGGEELKKCCRTEMTAMQEAVNAADKELDKAYIHTVQDRLNVGRLWLGEDRRAIFVCALSIPLSKAKPVVRRSFDRCLIC
jgi:hypothetical protein